MSKLINQIIDEKEKYEQKLTQLNKDSKLKIAMSDNGSFEVSLCDKEYFEFSIRGHALLVHKSEVCRMIGWLLHLVMDDDRNIEDLLKSFGCDTPKKR